MKQPPAIQADPIPGPAFDPMDLIVQDLQNVETFLLALSDNFDDADFLNTHLPPILGMRRTISHQLDKLADEPYSYPASRLQKLHAQNENLFIYVEGAAGEVMAKDAKKFQKALNAALDALTQFDDALTP